MPISECDARWPDQDLEQARQEEQLMSATGPGAPAQPATADREIVISRMISAPPDVVFDAFTEVRHLSRWWDRMGRTTRSGSPGRELRYEIVRK